MTYQQIIEQAETLSINEQKSLLSYLFLKYLNPEKQEFMHLFHYQNDFEKAEKQKSPLDNFMKSKGILKDIDLSDITEEDIYLQKD